MPGSAYEALEVAEEQFEYVTTTQAGKPRLLSDVFVTQFQK
jgi:hypothetical protein